MKVQGIQVSLKGPVGHFYIHEIEFKKIIIIIISSFRESKLVKKRKINC